MWGLRGQGVRARDDTGMGLGFRVAWDPHVRIPAVDGKNLSLDSSAAGTSSTDT